MSSHSPKIRTPDKLGPVLHSISGSLLLTFPDPTPKAGEVLVRVKASAVNPLDGIVRMGYFPMAVKPPLILGGSFWRDRERRRGLHGRRKGDRL